MAEDIRDFNPALKNYDIANDAKIKGPSGARGYKISPTRGNEDDSARYILKPDSEFLRPWLANPPNGSAFVWPLGTQGFQLSSQATAGIHHYIGDNDVDVDIVYPDELHITMTGHFPGKTSSIFKRELRKVILDPSGDSGKILSLPGVEEQILYVKVIAHSFVHDEGDNTSSIAYSVEFIRVGAGAKITLPTLTPPTPNPTSKKKARGKSSKRISVKQGSGSARRVTQSVYGRVDSGAMQALIKSNADALEAAGIPAYAVPFTPLPVGTVLKY